MVVATATSPGWPPGWHVRVVDETGSTNADLLAAAASGAPNRSVLAARHQTAGRGRLDRRWDAPPGANLLVSMLFRDVPAHPHELTRRVGLAVVGVAAARGVEATLKWPNDVMVGEAKLAGVLAQASLGARPMVVVGVGVNVGWAPPGAARLAITDPPEVSVALEATAVLDELLAELLATYDRLPADCEPMYRSRLATLGREVRVELDGGGADGADVVGRAVDVEPDGRLVVVDRCGLTHRFSVGDVVHLR